MNKYKRTLLTEIKYHCFYRWYNYLTDLKWKIPNIIERARFGVGFADTWSFDDYLCNLIIRGLKQIKENKGCPADIYMKYANDIIKPYTTEEIDRLAMNEWHLIEDKIILGFDMAKLMINNYEGLDHNERMLAESYRQEGFDLFKKYFMDLWD